MAAIILPTCILKGRANDLPRKNLWRFTSSIWADEIFEGHCFKQGPYIEAGLEFKQLADAEAAFKKFYDYMDTHKDVYTWVDIVMFERDKGPTLYTLKEMRMRRSVISKDSPYHETVKLG